MPLFKNGHHSHELEATPLPRWSDTQDDEDRDGQQEGEHKQACSGVRAQMDETDHQRKSRETQHRYRAPKRRARCLTKSTIPDARVPAAATSDRKARNPKPSPTPIRNCKNSQEPSTLAVIPEATRYPEGFGRFGAGA